MTVIAEPRPAALPPYAVYPQHAPFVGAATAVAVVDNPGIAVVVVDKSGVVPWTCAYVIAGEDGVVSAVEEAVAALCDVWPQYVARAGAEHVIVAPLSRAAVAVGAE